MCTILNKRYCTMSTTNCVSTIPIRLPSGSRETWIYYRNREILLMPERVDGVFAGSLESGSDAKDDTDGKRNADG